MIAGILRWGGKNSWESPADLIFDLITPVYDRSLRDRISSITFREIPAYIEDSTLEALGDELQVSLRPEDLFPETWNVTTYRV